MASAQCFLMASSGLHGWHGTGNCWDGTQCNSSCTAGIINHHHPQRLGNESGFIYIYTPSTIRSPELFPRNVQGKGNAHHTQTRPRERCGGDKYMHTYSPSPVILYSTPILKEAFKHKAFEVRSCTKCSLIFLSHLQPNHNYSTTTRKHSHKHRSTITMNQEETKQQYAVCPITLSQGAGR